MSRVETALMRTVYTLNIDYTKCTGCESCRVTCALKRERIANPLLGRIQVVHRQGLGLHIPVVCSQCQEAPCLRVCPVTAIARDAASDVVKIDYDKCIGCRYCTLACPFGAMLVHLDSGKPMKCDMCDTIEGGPSCYRVCHNRAINYVPITAAMHARRERGIEKWLNVIGTGP
jgi:carbon-monoxide dehydrogenase iron sulfur subunit